jgi:hypothetical protein
MIVDENLKVRTSEYIDAAVSKIKQLGVWSMALSILTIALLVILLFTGRSKNILKHENEVLKEQLAKDESMLTLEYSIGYWFINEPEPVTDSLLMQFLVENGAWYPKILLKQAKIESGNYSSEIFKNSCNLYGMKKVGKRQTTQIGIYGGYGVYTNWCESALDRLLWDVFYFKGEKPSKDEYIQAMSIYAEDTTYREKLL